MALKIAGSYRATALNLWAVLFQMEGNVMFAVLPLCILNCLLLGLVEYYQEKEGFGFSATGHGLMTLLVSFLVISKVNLAYERFKSARHLTGNAFLHLRDLTQLVIAISSAPHNTDDPKSIQLWRSKVVDLIMELLDCTPKVLQDHNLAAFLARNEREELLQPGTRVDPMSIVKTLRLHIYTNEDFELLERFHLLSKVDEYTSDYRALLDLASTPLPFPLVQMGRTFLFLWTFSMPLVLRQGPFTDLWTAMVFLFFLTYGFIGLELVSMKLANPFGDGPHDVQVTSLRDAVVVGIEEDLRILPSLRSTQQRRMQFQNERYSVHTGGSHHPPLAEGCDSYGSQPKDTSEYHVMGSDPYV